MILIFESTHAVINAEKKLIEAGFRPKVIPVPRDISSQCGMALAFNDGDDNEMEMKLREFMAGEGIKVTIHVDTHLI